MECAGDSVSGPRDYNEDSYLLKSLKSRDRYSGPQAFIMVSDGVGGHDGGDVASRIACEVADTYIDDLLRNVDGDQSDIDPERALSEIVALANDSIIAERDRLGHANMGATFVAAFVEPRMAWLGHVGDSRAYRVRNGAAEQLTIDHSVVGRLLASHTLTEEEAQLHPQRNVIERALGLPGAQVELTREPLRRGDALLLCSDGVSTVLNSKRLGEVVSMAKSISKAASSVTSHAVRAKTDDNATVVIATNGWREFHEKAPRISPLKRLSAVGVGGGQKSILILLAVMIIGLFGMFFAGRGPISGVAPSGFDSGEATQAVTQTAKSASEMAKNEKIDAKNTYTVKKFKTDKVYLLYRSEGSKTSPEKFKPEIVLKPYATVRGTVGVGADKRYLRLYKSGFTAEMRSRILEIPKEYSNPENHDVFVRLSSVSLVKASVGK